MQLSPIAKIINIYRNNRPLMKSFMKSSNNSAFRTLKINLNKLVH